LYYRALFRRDYREALRRGVDIAQAHTTKIVFIITGLPTGGAQMMLQKVLERLEPRFVSHVISLTTLGDVGPRIESLGIPVEALGMNSLSSLVFGFGRLIRKLKALRADVVHTWLYHADLIGGLAARLAGVPRVAWTIRNSNLDPDKIKRSTLGVVWLCARFSPWIPTSVLSCSEDARRIHIGRGYAAKKVVVVPNGFDISAFQPDTRARDSVRSELKLDRDTPLVGWVGRLHPHKNAAGFLNAAGRVHCRLPQAHFVLVGEGLEIGNPAVSNVVQASGIQGVTHLLGVRTDIPRLMAAVDVLASSSSGEAFSNVIGEAMSCGVPCAVTDVGDSAHIVGDTGRVVPPDDMAALAEGLEALLMLSPADRTALGMRARERVAQRFEIGSVVKQYEMFYDELGTNS
jgi:glycosyltransferase involved in cell wall biosynthesis